MLFTAGEQLIYGNGAVLEAAQICAVFLFVLVIRIEDEKQGYNAQQESCRGRMCRGFFFFQPAGCNQTDVKEVMVMYGSVIDECESPLSKQEKKRQRIVFALERRKNIIRLCRKIHEYSMETMPYSGLPAGNERQACIWGYLRYNHRIVKQ